MTPTQRSLKLLRDEGWTAEVVERVMSHIHVSESGCWEWTGARDRSAGYGRCSKKTAGLGEQWAHRMVYRLAGRVIPNGMQLDHLCRNRCCVNPSHLEPVSQAENSRRSPLMGMAYRARSAAKFCKHGHPRTPDNLYFDKRGFSQCMACRANRRKAKSVANAKITSAAS